MKRANVKTIYVTVICLIITLLCSCNLFVTDKDRFYLDKDLDYMLTWIDLEKTGSDIIIPSKVGDKIVKEISLKIHISRELIRWMSAMLKNCNPLT